MSTITYEVVEEIAPPQVESDSPLDQCVSEVLENSALYIEEYGWTQGNYFDTEGRVCILGALSYTVSNYPGRENCVRSFFGDACDRIISIIDMPIHEWNDEDGRTKEDVCRVLREASAKKA